MLGKPKEIPAEPGIYIFKNAAGKPLYVGKAASIKKRLASYFLRTIPDRVKRLREEAASVSFEPLETEFDALVREAELIKKYRPRFNILMRDDKGYNYVSFTKDEFPRIVVSHQPPAHARKASIIGPFTEGRPLYAILRLLRKSFPYCTCKKPHKRRCLNAEIGRCLGFCCTIGEVPPPGGKQEYLKNIATIRKILTGHARDILRNMRTRMEAASIARDFEAAATLRDCIADLQSIISHRFIIQDRNPFVLRHAKTSSSLQAIVGGEKPISRIEGYDISNISGAEATASLVVFQNGRPHTNEYKRFRIRYEGISDFDMLKETLRRRLNHPEWTLPDLMLIDGGTPQLRAAARVLEKSFSSKNAKRWPLVLAGLAKAKTKTGRTRRKASRDETLHIYPSRVIRLKDIPQDSMHTLQAVRDESHRFAKKYHQLLRQKNFLQQ